MITAKAWGIPPHKWDLMPLNSRAEMIAVNDIEGLITSYRQEPEEK